MKLGQRLLGLAAAGLLAACGGGGGGDKGNGSGNDLTVDTFPVDAAFVSLFTKGATFNVDGVYEGLTFDYGYRVTPLPDETQPLLAPTPLKVFNLTQNLSYEGEDLATSVSKNYFSTGPFLIWGVSYGSMPLMTATRQAPPATAKVGASGPLATFVSGSLADTLTWSLEKATLNKAWLCINTTGTDVDGPYSESNCVLIDKDGQASGYKSQFTSAGETFAFD